MTPISDCIDFLKAIGHKDRVNVRCLAPKNTPLSELEARGMTYTDKSGQVKKSTVNGYIDIQTGEFYRRYGKDYKPMPDGWGHLQDLNQQGYGVYFVVQHGGERNSDINHGSVLFHESDKLSIEQQQATIDRISSEFGKPTAVVKTKKSLHAYWASSETISIDNLATYQRRWLQYSNCDDVSLSDPAQLMRLPGFDHLTWNPETQDFDRIKCELVEINEVSYSLAEFDRILPELDAGEWASRSLEFVTTVTTNSDMRSLAPYLEGYRENGREGWDTAKCPSHGGESTDSLHIDRHTGAFICHAGCKPTAVYQAAKAVAVASGHRFEVVSIDAELSQNLKESISLKSAKAPNLFNGQLGNLLSIAARNFNIPVEILYFCLLPILGSQNDSRTRLVINPGTGYVVPPVRWSGLVGDSGTKKSPIISLLTQPLSGQQHELYQTYESNREIYESELQAWKAIPPKERGKEPKLTPLQNKYFSNFTIEGLVHSIRNYPNAGYLLKLDELASFFKSMDMYRGGKGSDRQEWLSIWNGDEIVVNRKNSDPVCIPQSAISMVGGIQPSTISNLVDNDENQFDGLWNRFSFMSLPHNKTQAFTEIPGDLKTELDRVYRALSGYGHQTHFLSIEAKPHWEAWHDDIEDRTISEPNGLLKGTYAKFEGIAARNALILHRTLAAIAGIVPDQLINPHTLELAIAWTGFELNQTLMEYQKLGLTDNPELSRILKFIDRFEGKGWIGGRDVTHWWSGRSKPNTTEIRSFMSKVASLGYAIDNGESIDSSKYQISIAKDGSNSSDKSSEPYTQSQESLLLPLVTENYQQSLETSPSIVTNFVTTDRTNGSNKNIERENIHTSHYPENFVTTNSHNGSNKPEMAVNGHHDGSIENSVTNSSNNLNAIDTSGFSDSVTTVTTISKDSNLKVGDRVMLGDEILTIDKIEGDFIGGKSDDGSYVGGDINSVKLLSVDESPANPKPQTHNGYTKKDVGNGFVQIIPNGSDSSDKPVETIDGVEVEYEC